jgi:5'-nucleotidase (lipoprotein e(P4) family)
MLRTTLVLIVSVVTTTPFVAAQGAAQKAEPEPRQVEHLEIKYVRDSAEYGALVRQVYRHAAQAVATAAASRRGKVWAVVLDVDETTLDNSTYQLERYAYDLPFDADSWNAWVARADAHPVPGVIEFVRAVRDAGGRVAWISNRDTVTREPTRQNLAAHGLWNDDDRLCLASEGGYTKAVRRREVVTGKGTCAWPDRPTEIVAFIGDQAGDFPATGESIPDAGRDEAFGSRFFLLPNPMYGAWERRVTNLPR